MSDKIKVRLSDNSKARLDGAHYFVFEGTECVFYDKENKELWRQKDSLKELFQ